MEFQILQLVEPLQGDATGEDPQTLPEYDALMADIAKMDGIEKVALDWSRICTVCSTLLTESTKDLKVANVLAFAWFQEHKFAGLSAGFEFLNALITSEFASNVFPRRKKRQEKARAASFVWLTVKVEKHFTSYPVEDIKQLDNAEAAISQFKLLALSLKDYLKDDAPLFTELKATFNRFSATIQEHKASLVARELQETKKAQVSDFSEPQKTPPVASPKVNPMPVVEMPKVASSADINKTLSAAGNAIKAVSQQLKESHTYSANAFYLSRTAKWMLIQELPANKIIDRQPNDLALKNLQTMESASNYEDLLNLAELEFNNGAIFCLSLHRYVYNALMALGQDLCAEVVLNTTLNFITRFPHIMDSTFKNGEPFVDELTKTWLSSVSASQVESSSDDPDTETNKPWIITKTASNKLIAEGKAQQAILLFQEGIDNARGIRESILWRYEMAGLLSKIGHDEMGVMNLRHILDVISNTSISQWQPELSVNVLKLMLECHMRIQQKSKYEPNKLEEVNKLKLELVKLSPSKALAFSEPKT